MSIDKYLADYAADESQLPFGKLARFSRCLVIPARDEEPLLLDRIQHLAAQNPGLLCILVINQSDDHPATATNLALAARIGNRLPLEWSVHERLLCCFTLPDGGALLVVDRFSSRGIPAAEGVGGARKIGCDIACRLVAEESIGSPWIHCSDADVSWPPGYFEAVDAHRGAALVYPFRHQVAAGAPGLPGALYELHLRYYVAGLNAARSPYAYHTIGSTIAVHAANYAMVRGFPRRSGGEDFYLLNKLRKTGAVITLNGPTLQIADRDSDRVPFGTGPGRDQINRLDDPLQQFAFYHPGVFTALASWLALTPELFDAGSPDSAWQLLGDTASGELPAGALAGLLEGMGARRALEHAFSHGRDLSRFAAHLHHWFDAFRTLKLIHALRDRYLPSMGLAQLVETYDALNPAIELAGISRQPPIDRAGQRDWLVALNAALAGSEQIGLAWRVPATAAAVNEER